MPVPKAGQYLISAELVHLFYFGIAINRFWTGEGRNVEIPIPPFPLSL